MYLKHEEMLDRTKQERQELASSFQKQMNEISDFINAKREERQLVEDANNQIRKVIAARIEDYKRTETEYHAALDTQKVKAKQTEKSLSA